MGLGAWGLPQPCQLARRGEWEVRVFFLIWMVALAHALWQPTLRGWAALLCLTLPLLDMVTAGGVPWADPRRLWLELSCVVMGATLLWLARKVGLRADAAQSAPLRATLIPKEMHP